jgi:YD repeat-containing protein
VSNYSATSKEKYYYNSNGLLIKKEIKAISKSNILGDSEENTIETYNYDENGNLIEKIVDTNGKKTITKYYYEKY